MVVEELEVCCGQKGQEIHFLKLEAAGFSETLLKTDLEDKIPQVSLLRAVICIERRFSWRFPNSVSCSKTVMGLLGPLLSVLF
jgi:hypothetical protein